MDQRMSSGKPFTISKQEVWNAWLKVKGNQGAPGVDGQTLAAFEADLKGNLYKIWNRMSSGSYLPPPVPLKRISQHVRSWRLHRRTGQTAADLARLINPAVRGWMAYYGAFYRSALHPLLHRINTYLLRWLMAKYRTRRTWKQALRAMLDGYRRHPRYFAHWNWAIPAARSLGPTRAV